MRIGRGTGIATITGHTGRVTAHHEDGVAVLVDLDRPLDWAVLVEGSQCEVLPPLRADGTDPSTSLPYPSTGAHVLAQHGLAQPARVGRGE